MLKELLKPEIHELIYTRNWTDLREILCSWPPPEIVDLFLDVEKTDRVLIFRALPREVAAEVFSYLDGDQKDTFLVDLTDQETRNLLADLPPDDRTELLEELPSKVTRRLMSLLDPDDLKEARELLGYPEESVGRRMTPDFVAVRSYWTIHKALHHIRKFGKDSETINRVYVTDKSGKLLDDIKLRSIILAEEDASISDLMDYNVVSLSAFDDQEKAVKMLEKYDLIAIPIVDSLGVLVGIVTFDDVMDISEEETTEDFQKIGGMNPVEQSYQSAGVFKLWFKRVPWLIALLFANFLTVQAIEHFDWVYMQMVALALFPTMLIGTAGNSGTQSATLIIRSIAVEGLNFDHWFEVMKKEIMVGLLLGLTLGAIAFLRGYLIDDPGHKIAIIVGLSMVVMVLWANLVGGLLPLFLNKMKFDPAVISSPFMATLIDFTGMIIYFNLSIWILGL
ncbi:MAG: magnesium transporter [Candidatus Kapabacteria bacterium]|nr:magnesium transporter [Ignavibacteriota bacterium]MCW5883756.1 magnesium transporter [Candidatus Kapabacteria bacterium]